MIALTVCCFGAVLIAFALTVRHHSDRVIDEVLAAEQRQIARMQAAGLEANARARWSR